MIYRMIMIIIKICTLLRRVRGAIISVLAPAFLFAAISYLSFFPPPDALVVRVSICMFMLLAM